MSCSPPNSIAIAFHQNATQIQQKSFLKPYPQRRQLCLIHDTKTGPKKGRLGVALESQIVPLIPVAPGLPPALPSKFSLKEPCWGGCHLVLSWLETTCEDGTSFQLCKITFMELLQNWGRMETHETRKISPCQLKRPHWRFFLQNFLSFFPSISTIKPPKMRSST